SIPPTAPAAVGSEVVEPGASGLKLSPIEAVQAYAAAKDDPAGESAELFDTALADGSDRDPARELWTTLVEHFEQPLATLAGGRHAASSRLVEGSVTALATADSGALVFGQVRSVLEASFEPVEGLSIGFQEESYTGLGAATLTMTKSARIEHMQTVVLAVPPADSEDPIRVIAVADVPTAVEVE
ncbi:MAG: hypothetical protein LBG60_06400, partial [Bifidobacteriaceae bacterium]|nr:hypothetical protein [Bifidobacteriaceae bacterium]